LVPERSVVVSYLSQLLFAVFIGFAGTAWSSDTDSHMDTPIMQKKQRTLTRHHPSDCMSDDVTAGSNLTSIILQRREGETINQCLPAYTEQTENIGVIFGQILPLPLVR
jgi:hypothetical protein